MIALPEGTWAQDFEEGGLAQVNIGEKGGWIDKTGKYVWKPSR